MQITINYLMGRPKDIYDFHGPMIEDIQLLSVKFFFKKKNPETINNSQKFHDDSY